VPCRRTFVPAPCLPLSTWHEIVTHLRPLPRTPRRHAPRHLAPNELRQLLPRFSPKYRGVAWTMFTTGMRISEYAEENHTHWSVLPDRVHVAGTKTAAASRDIPLVGVPVHQRIHPRSFAQIMRRVTDQTYQPTDLRRSYARLLADAGIPVYRQRVYMGHAVQTMTEPTSVVT
jgi:integrase